MFVFVCVCVLLIVFLKMSKFVNAFLFNLFEFLRWKAMCTGNFENKNQINVFLFVAKLLKC